MSNVYKASQLLGGVAIPGTLVVAGVVAAQASHVVVLRIM